jgi:hypothetical protein
VVFGGTAQNRKKSETSTGGILIDLLPPSVIDRSGKSPKRNRSDIASLSLLASARKDGADADAAGEDGVDCGGVGEETGTPGEGSDRKYCVSVDESARAFFELENSAFCFPCARHT